MTTERADVDLTCYERLPVVEDAHEISAERAAPRETLAAWKDGVRTASVSEEWFAWIDWDRLEV